MKADPRGQKVAQAAGPRGVGGRRVSGGTTLPVPSTAASRAPLEAPGSAGPGTQKSRPRGRRGTGAVLGRVGVVKIRAFPCHPFPLQDSLEHANVELCLHVCLFSFALPAQKRGPTGGKEGEREGVCE